MASDLSAYFGNKILRWINGAAMPTAPAGLYIAVYDGNPKTTGVDKSAVVGTARQVCTFAALASGVDHLLTSNVAVDFGNALAIANLSHFALFDAIAGNLLASKAIAGGPIAIKVGDGVKFLSGAITFNIGSDT
jgi:hypothetical protein